MGRRNSIFTIFIPCSEYNILITLFTTKHLPISGFSVFIYFITVPGLQQWRMNLPRDSRLLEKTGKEALRMGTGETAGGKSGASFVGQAHKVEGIPEGGTLCEKEAISGKVWRCRRCC
jgi:hypothetical protein